MSLALTKRTTRRYTPLNRNVSTRSTAVVETANHTALEILAVKNNINTICMSHMHNVCHITNYLHMLYRDHGLHHISELFILIFGDGEFKGSGLL